MSQSECINKMEYVQSVLEDLVSSCCEAKQFSRRNRELPAERFVQLLVLGWMAKGNASLNELARYGKALGIAVTGSAIHERIASPAVELLGAVLMKAVQQLVPCPRIPIALLDRFTAVHVTDSTQVNVPASLAGEFAGTRHAATVKVHVCLNYLTGQWVGAELVAGKLHDQKSSLPEHYAIPNSLNLFDLGYFNQERLRDIAEQEAYFVTRYQSQTALHDPQTHRKVNLASSLKTLPGDEVEYALLVGNRVRLPIRLVARRLSQSVADARRRKAKKRYTKDGKTCSKDYLFLLGWDILITNLPDECIPAHIFDLYPIRFQIEWLFRIWKSQLHLQDFGNWRRERVLCQLYARLLGCLLCHRLVAGSLWRHGREFSLAKCVSIIQYYIPALMVCIRKRWTNAHLWLQNLEDDFDDFARKSNRKKSPSTTQILMNWRLT